MGPSSVITAIVAALGVGANLVWTLTNLRIDARIGAKVDALKDWMGERYVSVQAFDGWKDVSEARWAEMSRRLTVLERAR